MDYFKAIKFSIIVPVYNARKYLAQCIESVLSQDYSIYELILVNDGSSDDSLLICQRYQSSYANILVLDIENQGASVARNKGIMAATGDYLVFIDSDDYFESNNLLTELSKAINGKNPDLLLYSAKSLNQLNGKLSLQRGNYDLVAVDEVSYIEKIDYLISNGKFPGSAWVFSVNRFWLLQSSIQFRPGIIAEDIDWCINTFRNAGSLEIVNDVFYVYRKNIGTSVSNTAGIKGVESILSIIEEWTSILSAEDKLDRLLLRNLAYYYFTSFISYAPLPSNRRNDLRERMLRQFPVTKAAEGLKFRVLRFLVRTIGIDLTAYFAYTVYKLKERIN